MPWWWWIAPALVGAFGVLLLIGAGRALFGGHFFKAGRGVVGGAVFSLVGLAAGLVGLNIQTYQRLTYERPVAILSAREVNPQVYSVTMCEPSGRIQVYTINGDQVRLEAFVLKWKPWATILGLDSQYQLDRIDGRYRSIRDEETRPRSLYALREEEAKVSLTDPGSWTDLFTKGINVLTLPDPLQRFAPAVDTRYGNGVFMPLSDGAVHLVSFTQTGMISRDGTAQDAAACAAAAAPPAAAKQ